VGGKWRLLILARLHSEPLRTAELRRRIPEISEKMLIQELKRLCMDRLVQRIDHKELPPKVYYKLTAVGEKVFPLLDSMKLFAEEYEAFLKK
jgi:DNA-binding HxlR family transcriptional regulator